MSRDKNIFMKAMSIIGIILFTLLLFAVSDTMDTDIETAVGLGCTAILYGLALSIVALINSNKQKKNRPTITQELLSLNQLKEKGILTEEEFQIKKMQILN